ncbi:hypothetical protein ACCS75_07310 [Rhizobium ruizarguesonis]
MGSVENLNEESTTNLPDIGPDSSSSIASASERTITAPSASSRFTIKPLDCGCGCGGSGACCKTISTVPAKAYPLGEFVYPVGRLGIDYLSKTNRDYVRDVPDLPNPDDKRALVMYLWYNHFKSENIVWTLTVEDEPVYVIEPDGAFASEIYGLLVRFLAQQEIDPEWVKPTDGEEEAGEEGTEENSKSRRSKPPKDKPQLPPMLAERVVIPGVIVGTRTLYFAGKQVPSIRPAPAGMYNWNIKELILEATKSLDLINASRANQIQLPTYDDFKNFVDIMMAELRNDGHDARDRARNFVATDIAEALHIFAEQAALGRALDRVSVQPSAVRPEGTDRWDVVFTFFDPNDQLGSSVTEYPVTVDVNYVVPSIVSSGPARRRSMRVVVGAGN